MRERRFAGFGEMDLIANPLDLALRAVAGLGIIGGGNELRWRWHVFDFAPDERVIDVNVLFSPDASEGLDRWEVPQPGLLARAINRLEQRLAIRPDDRRERFTSSICLGHLVVFDPMAIAVIPFRRCQDLYPGRRDYSETVERRAEGLPDALQPIEHA